jgi:hypothetical protein
MRCIKFLRLFFLEFQISEFEFQFLNFSTAKFEKNLPTGIFGIENGIRIPPSMGVSEIGTENWNSQPSPQAPQHCLSGSPNSRPGVTKYK